MQGTLWDRYPISRWGWSKAQHLQCCVIYNNLYPLHYSSLPQLKVHTPLKLCLYNLSKAFSNAKVLSMSGFVTTLQQFNRFWTYRSWWNARQVYESTTTLQLAGCLFLHGIWKLRWSNPFQPRGICILGHEFSRVRCDNYAVIISLYLEALCLAEIKCCTVVLLLSVIFT